MRSNRPHLEVRTRPDRVTAGRTANERLDLDVAGWIDKVERYGGLFYRLAGKLESLRQAAATAGLSWLRGQKGARQRYGSAS